MTDDNDIVLIHHDWLCPTKHFDAIGDVFDLIGGMHFSVPFIRMQIGRAQVFDVHFSSDLLLMHNSYPNGRKRFIITVSLQLPRL